MAGDLYDEEQILQWLLTQKDPSGEVIEALEGEELLNLIRESESLAVYFCKLINVPNHVIHFAVYHRTAIEDGVMLFFSRLIFIVFLINLLFTIFIESRKRFYVTLVFL